MKEKLSDIWEKIKAFFGAMSRTTKIVVAVAVVVVLLILFGIWSAQRSQPYDVVFYDLTSADITKVSTWLSDNGVSDYRIEGSNILVPTPLLEQTKAALYMEGYPSSGSGYDTYYANIGAMSTEGDKETALQQDLQERLAGVIRQYNGVKDATVTFSMGEDYRYVLDSSNITKSTASVFLTLYDTERVSDSVATAIRLAVTHAVSDLEVGNVTISDNWGNVYTETGTGVDQQSEASLMKLYLEEETNNRIRTDVMRLLTAVYGANDVRVSVSSVVDVNRKIVSSTDYPEPDWGVAEDATDGRGIIGQETWYNYVYGPDGTSYAGIVGATPNSDVPVYPYDTDGDGVADTFGGSNGEIIYNNPEVVSQEEYLAGTVMDVQIGVTLNSNAEAATAITLEELVTLIGTTAGIQTELQADKVSVLLAPFAEVVVEEESGLETWMIFAILAGLAVFIIIVIIIIVLMRKKKRQAEEEEQAALEEEERLERERQEEEAAAVAAAAAAAAEGMAPADGADIMDLNTEKSMELRKDLRTFVGNNPEIAASLLRNLMKGGEPVDAT